MGNSSKQGINKGQTHDNNVKSTNPFQKKAIRAISFKKSYISIQTSFLWFENSSVTWLTTWFSQFSQASKGNIFMTCENTL